MERDQSRKIRQDLQKKMVFITGPRQVGKTWLANTVATSFQHVTYLNEDHADDREVIRSESWHPSTDLLIFDELHKMPNWKNYLKGVYDTKPKHLHILVTGSARLDTFRQTGDALTGRFFAHRLLPFSPAELSHAGEQHVLHRLLARGGFPEPYLADSDTDAERWRRQYMDGLIRTDILDFERVHDLRAMQMIVELLRRRVGSLTSFASLARDTGLSPTTVARYIAILEALYIVFRVTPFARSIDRSLRKEPKLYFYDLGMVIGEEASRLENLVAVSLLKHCFALEDAQGIDIRLHFLRTKEGREVDFCLVRDGAMEMGVEVKLHEKTIDRNLSYFCTRYGFRGVQLVSGLRLERVERMVELRNAEEWLCELQL